MKAKTATASATKATPNQHTSATHPAQNRTAQPAENSKAILYASDKDVLNALFRLGINENSRQPHTSLNLPLAVLNTICRVNKQIRTAGTVFKDFSYKLRNLHTAQSAENKAILYASDKDVLNALFRLGINTTSRQPHTSLNLPLAVKRTIYRKFPQNELCDKKRKRVKTTAAGTVFSHYFFNYFSHSETVTLQRAKEILTALERLGINPASKQPYTALNLPLEDINTIYSLINSKKPNVAAGKVFNTFLSFAAKSESEGYFYERVKQAFGNLPNDQLTSEAAKHGLSLCDNGIAIAPRNFDGTPFLYDKTVTFNEIDNDGEKITCEAISQHTYQIIRNTPLSTKYKGFFDKKTGKYKTKPKYLAPSKEKTGVDGVPPQPNNVVLKNLKKGVKGGTLFLTEGYFKAVFLGLFGVPCVAFNGIQMFDLTDEIKDYLLKLEVEKICILFDNDATNLGSANDMNRTDNGRLKDFFTAVLSISEQIFSDADLKKIKVFYCEVNKTDATKDEKGEYIKAFDDLIIYHNRNTENAPAENRKSKEIASALESLTTNVYFKSFQLFRAGGTTAIKYTKVLKSWFACDSYRTFYNQHIKPQGKSEFTFDKTQYFYKNGVPLLSKHPFLVAYDGLKLNVAKYASDVAETIQKAILSSQLTAISAATGIGKTTLTFELGELLQRKIILCVPLRSIAQQQANQIITDAKERNKQLNKEIRKAKQKNQDFKQILNEAKKQNIDFALLQGGTITDRNGVKISATTASQKDVIICTYDTLHKVENLQDRILFVDEAHELVDAYNYRNDELLTVLDCLNVAYKSVLLSGTMPMHLAKLLDANLIEITAAEQQSKVFKIHEAKKGELIPTFLHLLKSEKKDNTIDVVLLNHTETLKELQKMLIDCGEYQPHEIAIFSRSIIDSEGNQVYENLLTANKLQGVKLVLTTSIIKQGVNVNNQLYHPKHLFDTLENAALPINNVYTVGVNNANELLQFSARFRKMETVTIHTILPQERNIDHDNFFAYENTENYTAAKIEAANIFAKLENERETKPQKTTHSKAFTHPLNDDIYYSFSFKMWKVDILKILYKEQQRKITYGNNAALFTELAAAPNTTVQFANDTTEPAAEFVKEVKQKFEQSAEQRSEMRENSRTEFLSLCEKGQERLVIDNIYLKGKQHRNADTINFFETYYYKPQGIAPPAELPAVGTLDAISNTTEPQGTDNDTAQTTATASTTASELINFFDKNKEAFAGGYFTKIAKAFVLLKFWQCDDVLTVLRNNTDNDLKLILDRLNTQLGIFSKNTIQHKHILQLQKDILENCNNENNISFGNFLKCVRVQKNLGYTPSELRKLFNRLFDAEKITRFSFQGVAPITAQKQKDGLKITIRNDVFTLKNTVFIDL